MSATVTTEDNQRTVRHRPVTLYDRFLNKAQERRKARMRLAGRSIFSQSALLQSIAHGLSYRPPHFRQFPDILQSISDEHAAGLARNAQEVEKFGARRAELVAIVESRTAFLASAMWAKLSDVVEAQNELSAAEYLLTLTPDVQTVGLAERVDALALLHDEQKNRLRAWLDALRSEYRKIKSEIEELERSGAPVSLDGILIGDIARLVTGLDHVGQAIFEAEENLRLAEK